MTEILYGKAPVREAIRAGKRTLHHFYYQSNLKEDSHLQEVLRWATEKRIPVEPRGREWFAKQWPEQLTQGWAARVSGFSYSDWDSWVQKLEATPSMAVLALDQIQDPQNLGAMLRTAECSGVQGVLLTDKHSSPISAAVCKASAGAVEHLDIFRVTNLVRSLKELKNKGFWVVGTTADPERNALDFSWPEKTALVLGSEGKGMRRLVRETCDFLIHLPLTGKIQSLNVSAAAAVCLYQIVRSRQ